MHFVGEQTAIASLVTGLIVARLIQKGVEKIRGRRAKRAIRIGLNRAYTQVRASKRLPDADLQLIVNLSDQRRGIYTSRQLAFVKQFVVDRNVSVVRIHVLDAGHAERGGMCQSALHGMTALIVGQWRNCLKQNV